MNELYNKLIEKIKSYNKTCDFSLIKTAYDTAVLAHSGQNRKSGEPYVCHPLSVAIILAEMELDCDSIVAAILHDTIEDTKFGHEEIKNIFGEQIVSLVEGVTKLGKIPYSTKEEQQVENLRKMFLAMAKDIRVILIKLADRLHNIRTLASLSDEKRRAKAWETLEVYAPLAHRLGIFKIKTELEDLSLKYLDPIGYNDIKSHIEKLNDERKEYIKSITETVENKLSEMGIKFVISGRTKNIYSTYKKMYAQNKSIEEIYDLFAIRVIVDSVADCYAVLGMVHELFKPIPGRFKDYIAMPKPNAYQSLHSTMIGTLGTPFEIQIRTWEMHRTAEFGIAAHWKYKEGKSGLTDLDNKLSWVRQLIEIQKETTDAQEFMKSIKIDLFADEVFVFTPKGDVINLPAGSNPIDFAFAIHSAVGNKMMGAKVNGKIVPIDHTLLNGDIVEVLTSSSVHGPSFDWLKIAKTSQARNKINQWFKKEKREENIIKGKETIEKELKKYSVPYNQVFTPEFIESIVKRFSMTSFEDVLSAIGYGAISISKITPKIKDEINKLQKTDEKIPIIKEYTPKNKKGNNGIIVEGIENCLVRLSKCCNPVPGDKIIGYITRGRGVSVHRKDCQNISFLESIKDEATRIIKVYWANMQNASYTADIQIVSQDRNGLLSEITMVFSEYKIPLRAVNAKTTKDNIAIVQISLEVLSTQQLENLTKRLLRISGVYKITRVNQ